MIVIGLTGSIGMGKSTVGAMLRKLGVPLFDADAAVHELYAPGGEAVPMVGHAFPEAIVDGAVDRARLSKLVLGKPDAIKTLETIVHPLVGRMRKRFLDAARARGEPFVVLDIPLLFEGRGRESVDRVVVVSAPADAQRERVLARPGMSAEKFAAILAQQVPDAEKRAQADLVIDTGVSLAETGAQVRALVESLRREAGRGPATEQGGGL